MWEAAGIADGKVAGAARGVNACGDDDWLVKASPFCYFVKLPIKKN